MSYGVRDPKSHVYLIEAENGRVKIGRTVFPERRWRTLFNQCPIKTRLIAVMDGDMAFERELHRKFAPFRVWGEWFSPCGEFAEFIQASWGRGLREVREWSDLSLSALQAEDAERLQRNGDRKSVV